MMRCSSSRCCDDEGARGCCWPGTKTPRRTGGAQAGRDDQKLVNKVLGLGGHGAPDVPSLRPGRAQHTNGDVNTGVSTGAASSSKIVEDKTS